MRGQGSGMAWFPLPSVVALPAQDGGPLGPSFTNHEMPHFLRASDCSPPPSIVKTWTLWDVSCNLQRIERVLPSTLTQFPPPGTPGLSRQDPLEVRYGAEACFRPRP